MIIQIIWGVILLFSFSLAEADTFLSYQEEIQKLFLKEASDQQAFKKAVQTARLLAYLEFMPLDTFGGFYQCLKKENQWAYLSEKKRERLLNLCRSQGREVSSLAPAVRPAEDKKWIQGISEIRTELADLRNQIARLSKETREQSLEVSQALTKLSDQMNALRADALRVENQPPQSQTEIY